MKAGVIEKCVLKKMCAGAYFHRRFCPTRQIFPSGQSVQVDRNTCSTLTKYVLYICMLLQYITTCARKMRHTYICIAIGTQLW